MRNSNNCFFLCIQLGVGGSGKQSLSRLASFINNYDVVGILVNQTYDVNALKTDIQVRGYNMNRLMCGSNFKSSCKYLCFNRKCIERLP